MHMHHASRSAHVNDVLLPARLHRHCTHGWCTRGRPTTTSTSSSSNPPPKLVDDGGWGELPAGGGGQTQHAAGPPSSSRIQHKQRPGQGSSSSSSSSSNSWFKDHSSNTDRDDDSSSSSRNAGYSGDATAGSGNSRGHTRPSPKPGSWQPVSRGGLPRGPGAAAAAAVLPGDWLCPDCGELNFARRDSCRSCEAPRPAQQRHSGTAAAAAAAPTHGSRSSSSAQEPAVLPGDWTCSECGDLNFARRTECRSCLAPRPPGPASSTSSSSFSPQPGDWTCPQCGDVNFARRTECRSCLTPRPRQAAGRSSSYSSRWANSSSSSSGDIKERRKKASTLVAKGGAACCYGCGAPLQTEVPAAAGYVAADKFETKKKHKQLKQVLCARCTSLAHGAMIPAVKDFTQKAWLEQQQQLLQQQQQPVLAVGVSDVSREPLELLGKVLVTAEELRDKIAEVASVKALVVMLVDLLDVSGTLMGKVRDMVGNNPIVLVGTKMDLLPQGCSPKEMAAWLTEAAARRKLMVTSTHLISSRSGEGVAVVASKVARERKGRDVFVVGAANVGKSAFVCALLREMSSFEGGNFDAAAAATRRYLPVESAMPGTTLGIIPLQAFETGGTLYDTPGVHLHHRVPHMLTPDELKLLHPRRRLVPFTPPTPLDIMREAEEEEEGEAGGQEQWKNRVPQPASEAAGGSSSSRCKPKRVCATYLWSGLVRVDVLSGPPSSSLVFYGPSSMRVAPLPLVEEGQQVELDPDDTGGSSSDDDDAQLNSSSSSSSRSRVLLCRESVAARGGLVPHTLRVPMPQIPTSQCLADVAVSGLPGWVGLHAPFATQPLELRVWVPRGVEVFLRPPIPCPPPPKPSARGDGEEEEEGLAEDLADIGKTLEMAEADQDWELHRDQLGLRPMSAEDEEVVKMLLYGNEGRGLTGIMDMDDDELDELDEDEDEGEDGAAGVSFAAAGQHPAAAGSGADVTAAVEQALRAEQLSATAAEAILPGRRHRPSSSSSSSSRTAQGITVIADDEGGGGDVPVDSVRRRRRQR